MEGALEVFVDVVSRVGFPIAVAAFVLVRLNGKMDRLTDALHKVAEQLANFAVAAAKREGSVDARLSGIEGQLARKEEEGC
jgi:hypothetical protein